MFEAEGGARIAECGRRWPRANSSELGRTRDERDLILVKMMFRRAEKKKSTHGRRSVSVAVRSP